MILGKGVKRIAKDAFSQCELLHNIIIPPAIKIIKDFTFYRCVQLTTVIFEDTVIFGDGLMEIGHGAFMDAHHFMR